MAYRQLVPSDDDESDNDCLEKIVRVQTARKRWQNALFRVSGGARRSCGNKFCVNSKPYSDFEKWRSNSAAGFLVDPHGLIR